MSKTAWDLAMELITLMTEYDNKVSAKSKEKVMEKWIMIDGDIIRIENLIFSIKEKLKKIEV